MASHQEEAMAEEQPSGSATESVTAAPDQQTCGPAQRAREKLRRIMLERLATTSAHFVHLQRDAPDLTSQEKVDIAAEILDKSPATFLGRFGKFLEASDLAFFEDLEKDSYEVGFYLKEIRHRCAHSQVIVKNRRYAAMRELEKGGAYFSEDEMKHREPLLYEQMVGQYLTEEEQKEKVAAAIDRTDLRFSTILLTHMDDLQERALYQHQKDREDDQEEEEEDSDEEEEDEDEEDASNQQKGAKTGMEEEEEEEEEEVPEISGVRASDIWRQQLRDEFTAIMHEKFLSGEDSHFDYSQVDDNPDYDSLVIVAQDEENKLLPGRGSHTVDKDSTDSDRESVKRDVTKMEEQEEEEEEEDYMLYEPPADLVAKSARFVQTGAWKEEGVEDG